MLYHTVLFQFHEDTSQHVIDDILEHHRRMAEIPAVLKVAVGPNLMPRTGGWTHGMTMVFRSRDSMMDEFAGHPLHQAVLREDFPIFSAVLAMDVESDDTE